MLGPSHPDKRCGVYGDNYPYLSYLLSRRRSSHNCGHRAGDWGGDDTSPAAKRAWSFPESPCAGRKRRRTHVGNKVSVQYRSASEGRCYQ
eukprot:scaffold8702_cov67-Phaeocystis_antarctica.AAC.1